MILKVMSESRVTWATSVPILVFLGLSVLDLGPMYATDSQTSDTHHRLTPLSYGRWHNKESRRSDGKIREGKKTERNGKENRTSLALHWTNIKEDHDFDECFRIFCSVTFTKFATANKIKMTAGLAQKN